MKKLEILEADFTNEKHCQAIVNVTNRYAEDPMGLGDSLPDNTRTNLIHELSQFPTMICFIAFFDGEVAGVANCFFGFSTFRAAKVLNIHDLAVMPSFRGKGIGEALLGTIEKKARDTGCCKVTLEVREDNRARGLYERYGFSYGEPTMYFMTKEL
jgi:ribosomal protein S18 acetylase RimI-like enzyme